MNEADLLWGLLFSSIGIGYFIYGRRQSRIDVKYCGLGLMLYPVVVSGVDMIIAVGLALCATPFLIKKFAA